MKKEYQYLIVGAVISAAVLMGMGIVGEEKQVTEGRYQFVPYVSTGGYQFGPAQFPSGVGTPAFGVMDTQTGTVNAVSPKNETLVFPFAATKAE